MRGCGLTVYTCLCRWGGLVFSVFIFHPAPRVLLAAPLPSSVHLGVCLASFQNLPFLFEALSSSVPPALDVSLSV